MIGWVQVREGVIGRWVEIVTTAGADLLLELPWQIEGIVLHDKREGPL